MGDPQREDVVVLHGLGRSARTMAPLARALGRDGFRVTNVDYPSRCAPIRALAQTHVGGAVERLRAAGAETIHFVTHSMGGILVRQYVEDAGLPEIGRVVMLAPPNGGSEVADLLSGVLPFRWYCGPALDELGTGAGSVPRRLGPPPFEVGVIAGRRSIFPWFHPVFGAPNDGLVSLESTRVEGMADWVEVPRTHALLMMARPVIALTRRFLETGRFGADEGLSA